MTRFFSMSIRAQLLLMALIVALPVAGFVVYSGLKQRKEAVAGAIANTEGLADTISSGQKHLVDAAQQLMSALAQLPEVKQHNPAKAQPILADILKINPQYANIFVADHAGNVWASAVPLGTPFSVADRRYFRQAVATGQFSSGEYAVGRILGKPAISFAYPCKGTHGEITGVVAVTINQEFVRNLFENARLPSGSNYILLDRRGIILDRYLNPAQYVGKRDKPELFRQMQNGPDRGSFAGKGFEGVERFFSYRKLYLNGEQSPYLHLRVTMPVNVALAKANSALFQHLALFAAILVLSLSSAWLIGKRSIVDRVSALRSVSQRIAAGDLQARVAGFVQGGELGELGRSFDDMAAALARDFAARKQAEDALQESEQFLRAIIDTEPECVKLLAADGTLLMMNRAGLAMIGAASFAQVKGQSISPLVAPGYRDAYATFMERVLQGKEGRLEFEIVALDGRRCWLDSHAVPFFNKRGEIVSLLAITQDITERKRAETEIVLLNATLAERAAELENANREMEAFNYTVSHDLHKPLTVIEGYCQVLLGMQGGNLDPRCGEYLRKIYDGTLRMNQLIDTLLRFSRLMRAELRRETVDLSEMARVIAAELRLTDPERQVMLLVAEGVTVNGDPNLLRVVLENLLGNAWKYTGNRAEGVIEFGMVENGGRPVCFVRDNGAGFDMAHAEKLFLPFQRLPGADAFKGCGIGLATVERIIRRHGGRVWAEGEAGKGATFSFSL